MGKTSTEVKRRWNTANYDYIQFCAPKGTKDVFKKACEKAGVSMAHVLNEAVQDFLQKHEGL